MDQKVPLPKGLSESQKAEIISLTKDLEREILLGNFVNVALVAEKISNIIKSVKIKK